MTADNEQTDGDHCELIASGHISLNPVEGTKNAQVRVRKLPGWVVQTLKEIAGASGKSLEEFLRTVLLELALKPQHDFAKALQELREEIKGDFQAGCPSSEELVRSVREES